VIALLALISLAHAQDSGGWDAHGRALAPTDNDPLDPLWGYRPEQQVKGSLGGYAGLQWADSPLVAISQVGDTETREAILGNALGLNLAGQYAVHQRAAIGLSLPIWATTASAEGRVGPALGDLRLAIPVGLVMPGQEGEGFGLSIVPLVDLPTGAAGRWLGDNGPGAGGLLAAGFGTGKLSVVGDVGVMTASKIEVDNLVGGAALLADLSASYLIKPEIAVRVEGRIDPGLAGNTIALAGTPAELAVSVRRRPEVSGLSLTGGASAGLTRGASAARYRVFLGLGYTARKAWPVIIPDTDGDGLLDNVDACPNEPEVVNTWKDEDGCPDALAQLAVNVTSAGAPVANAKVLSGEAVLGTTDAQGALRVADQLPESQLVLVADHAGYFPNQPVAITLVEGDQSANIEVAAKPGTLKVRVVDAKTGAPVVAKVQFKGKSAIEPAEVGADGLSLELPAGDVIALVQAEGYGVASGKASLKPGETTELTLKLEPARVEVVAKEIQILDKVYFDFDKADIKPESFKILREVAATMLANPQITKVEVQGHTDSDGDDKYNVELSQRRVESVVAFLAQEGVEASRLTPKGYGEGVPLVPNTTEANKATNRRVQFIILEQTGAAAPAPGDKKGAGAPADSKGAKPK
jgi:outer membrane protein OmpA-like peptidoglycan-associated protein